MLGFKKQFPNSILAFIQSINKYIYITSALRYVQASADDRQRHKKVRVNLLYVIIYCVHRRKTLHLHLGEWTMTSQTGRHLSYGMRNRSFPMI